MASEEGTFSGFTSGETKILMSVIKHLKGDLDTDFDAVATELGYKDATIAKTRLRQIIRKKIRPAVDADGEKATPKKRKGAAASKDDVAEESPAKEGRGRKAKGGKAEDGSTGVKPEQMEEETEAVETTE
ncbi:hypothetical protein LTR53_014957 [Teratosphaeriaceae sp. CCFEE 6253]|nr:hypothetical protein LTR53_014957 [Teratosphaeriaceae sp. CCFEE 6253]